MSSALRTSVALIALAGCTGEAATAPVRAPRPAAMQLIGNDDGLLHDVVQIAAGSEHTCARLAGGAVRCWGDDDDGEVSGARDIQGAVDVVAGSLRACARVRGGALLCWGHDLLDDVAADDAHAHRVLEKVAWAAGATAVAIGDRGTCAVVAGGAVWCDSLGNMSYVGTPVAKYATGNDRNDVSVIHDLPPIASLGLGGGSCVVSTEGMPYCWSELGWGEAGNGVTHTSSGPGPVSGLRDVVQIAMGGAHGCALTRSGEVDCWGRNDQGQVGDGTTTDRTTPVRVGELDGAVQLSLGGSQSCARMQDGTVRCWGEGRGRVPAPVRGLRDVVDLAVGGEHACALVRDGTVRCWGRNLEGELGDGTSTDSADPVAVIDR